jgi:hypothetical protein
MWMLHLRLAPMLRLSKYGYGRMPIRSYGIQSINPSRF